MRTLSKFQRKAVVVLTLLAFLLFIVPLQVYAGEDTTPDFSSTGRVFSKQEIAQQEKNDGLARIIDRSDEKYNVQSISADAALSTDLPSKVDLRENGTVTPVKNQGYTGTCWAFGFMAAAETTIANSTLSAPTNLSPYQLAYFAYEPLSKDTSQLIGSEVTQAGEGLHMKEGLEDERLTRGCTETTAASLIMQGCGITFDTSIPFSQNALSTGFITDEDKLTLTQRRESVARLNKFSYLGCVATTKKDEEGNTKYVSTNEKVLARIKQQVASGNAVTTSYFGDDVSGSHINYIAPVTYAQYTYEYQIANHVVCVVGYDDTYSKDNFIEGHKPPADGAFIVKNSWSDGWGLDGYFYLSYYDQSLAETFLLDFDVSTYDGAQIDVDKEIIDQYDYLQANIVLAYKEDDPDWYSNVFTSTKKQQLHSIVTYVCDDNTELIYKVYKLKSDATTPLDVQGSLDNPDAEGIYVSDYEGYINIKLDEPINLLEGEKYAIIFSQDTLDGNSVAPVPVQYADSYTLTSDYGANTVINEGESFYLSDPVSGWNSWTMTYANGLAYDNYCAKGYATSMVGIPFVVFDAQGGSTVATQAVEVGGFAEEPEDPTRAGYVFSGWFTDVACTQAFDFSTQVLDDITLWAKWEVDSQSGEVVPVGTSGDGGSKQVSDNASSHEVSLTTKGTLSSTGDGSLIIFLLCAVCLSGAVVLTTYIAKRSRQQGLIFDWNAL